MMGLWPTTEPNNILYWNYNRLVVRSECSHALGGKTESDIIELFYPVNERFFSKPAQHLSFLPYLLLLLDYSGSEKPYNKEALYIYICIYGL